MSTQIKYTNNFGEVVTPQQANQLSKYDEQTYIDNRLKIEKKYYNNELEGIYIYPDENESAILNTLTEPDFEYSIIKDFEIINGYNIWKSYAYKNGVLSSEYSMEVFDAQGRNIAVAGYYGDGSIRWGGWKMYYISNNVLYDDDGEMSIGYDESSYIEFDFMSDELIISLPYEDDDKFDMQNFSRFLEIWQPMLPLMTSELLAYFMDPNQLVPPANLNIV